MSHTPQPDEARIEALVAELTLEEKVSLLAGDSFWTTPGVERLGIPPMKVSDGPNGARGAGGFSGGEVTSAAFPVGIALASTWNPALVEQAGQALAQEARAKGAHMLLAPTVNIHRSPLNGRNFECYSEDPYLTARMAVAYISGVQSEGVGATVKHFAANDSEYQRNTISSEVDERTLREIYLPPFEAAVREAGSWGVMSAYNRINGTYAGEHPLLLNDILKREWGFDGIVMSDWFGTNSTVGAASNGLDLEMPGPPRYRGERLLAAVRSGEVRQEAIDESVRRMLRTLERVRAAERPAGAAEQAIDRPEHRALIRAAGAEGAVLLKNDGVLPLDPAAFTGLAVIGPNARTAQIMGGGSAQVNAHYMVSPFDGLVAALGERVELGYEIGCTNHKLLPRPDASAITRPDGARGVVVRYYPNLELAGEPALEVNAGGVEQFWMGPIGPGVDPGAFSASITGTLTPRESGRHTLGIASAGLSRLFVDGELLIDNWTQQTGGDVYFGMGSTEVTAELELEQDRPREIRLEYSRQGGSALAAVRLGMLGVVGPDSIDRAARLAARSDVALVFVGTSADWESEGFDRPDMELPAEQNALVERVAAANPRTVVVLQTGSPVAMPWLDKVAAVVQAWFPGQEAGNAIADVLTGAAEPSGRLPQTFPRRVEDNPAFVNYPGENGRVHYGERIFVGYRYYEKKKVEPLFPFGFGLSYTTFSYGAPRLSAETLGPDDTLTVEVDVTNTGTRPGSAVVQLYIRDAQASVARPEKELKAFAKLALAPGQTGTATLAVTRESLAYWDDARHAWVAEAGDFAALVGTSSADIFGSAPFTLTQTAVFGGPPRVRAALSVDSKLRELLDDDESRAVLERHLPGFTSKTQVGMALGMALSQLAGFDPGTLTPERLAAIAADLAALRG